MSNSLFHVLSVEYVKYWIFNPDIGVIQLKTSINDLKKGVGDGQL